MRRAQLHVHGGEHRGHLRVQVPVARPARGVTRARGLGQRFLRPSAQHLGARDSQLQPDAVADRLRSQSGYGRLVCLDRVRECIRGEVEVTDCLLLRDPWLSGPSSGGIRGD